MSKIQIPGVGTDFGPLKYMPNQNLKKFRKQQRLITVENMVLGASLPKIEKSSCTGRTSVEAEMRV